LYETTQGPPVQLDEPVALNPTGGVIRKVQATFKGLKYQKDTTRPGGGVFIAHGKAKEGDYSNMPEGTVIINHGVSDEESEGAARAAAAGGSPPGSATSMINYTPLSGQVSGSYANVNPALNMSGSSDVQVLNVLSDVPQQPSALQQFAMADSGLLEGLPGSMFDWPQWEHFFCPIQLAG